MVLGAPAELTPDVLAAGLGRVLDAHDMLRARVTGDGSLVVGARGSVDAARLVTRMPATAGNVGDVAERTARDAVGRLDPAAGILVQAVWVDAGQDRVGRVVLVVHHLVVDGVSWRVLVPDLAAACESIADGAEPRLDPIDTSFRGWAELLATQAVDADRVAELDGWVAVVDGPDPLLGDRPLDPARDTAATVRRRSWTVPAEHAASLVGRMPAVFHCGVHEVLLAALAGAVAHWRAERAAAGAVADAAGVGAGEVLVDVEGHGRESLAGTDLSRTVGWFTSVHPVRLRLAGVDLVEARAGRVAAGQLLKAVKEQARSVPGDGLGYGLLRHLNAETGPVLAGLPSPQIGFNYLGRFAGAAVAEGGAVAPWQPAGATAIGYSADPDMPAPHTIEAGAAVRDTPAGPELTISLSRPAEVLDDAAVERLGRHWLDLLAGLAAHTEDPAAGGHTPSDFPLIDLAQDEVERFEAIAARLEGELSL
jgi:nonribosomal peptide synthetase CepB